MWVEYQSTHEGVCVCVCVRAHTCMHQGLELYIECILAWSVIKNASVTHVTDFQRVGEWIIAHLINLKEAVHLEELGVDEAILQFD